jgi:hypothetical protein
MTTIALTTPYIGLSSRRATSVTEMFTVNRTTIDWDYDIGLPQLALGYFVFTNVTLNIGLAVHIDVPSIAELDKPNNFVIGPNSQINFAVTMNGVEVRRRALDPPTGYVENLLITVTPLNVIGPVFLPDSA